MRMGIENAMRSLSKWRRAIYWVALPTLVGLVALGIWLRPEPPALLGDATYQPESVTYMPGGLACDPARLDLVPEPARVVLADACAEIREQHRLAENDLLQQRRAATAAERAASLSFSQTWIALVGLLVGTVTLAAAGVAAYFSGVAAAASRDAARQAEISANHADSAAEIARETLKLEKETSRKQTRPYVVYLEADLKARDDEAGRWALLRLDIENCGTTPAIVVAVSWSCYKQGKTPGTELHQGKVDVTRILIGSEKQDAIKTEFLFAGEAKLPPYLQLGIRVYYEGVDGEGYSDDVWLFWDGDKIEQGPPMAGCVIHDQWVSD